MHIHTNKLVLAETTTNHDVYYIIPKHRVAIPAGANAQDTLNTVLGRLADYSLSDNIVDYPAVNHHHLVLHFGDYEIIPLLKSVLVTRPVECFSGHEQLAIARQRELQLARLAEEKALARQDAIRDAEIEVEI
jgi:hypothetical protein